MIRRFLAAALAAALAGLPHGSSANALPRPAHVVVVVEENHTLAQVIGSADATYLGTVAQNGALFTHAYGVTHPSQPNYFALLAGLLIER